MICRACGRHNAESVGKARTVYSVSGRPCVSVSVPFTSVWRSVNTSDAPVELLAGAHVERRIDHLASVDDHRLQHPAARCLRPDPRLAGRDAGQREPAVLVDPRVDGGPEGRIGRLRGDANLRRVRLDRLASLKGDRAGQRRAGRHDHDDAGEIFADDGDRRHAGTEGTRRRCHARGACTVRAERSRSRKRRPT